MPYTRRRKQWGARGHGGSPIGRVGEVVGHTEAGPYISPTALIAQEQARMRAIDAFHLSLGWSGGFGYSVGIFPSGRIYEGRGYGRSGAHTRGRNTTALAFVIPGHGDRTPMTRAAIQAARHWIGNGVKDGHIDADPKISGHRDYSNKSCPGNKIYPQLRRLRGVMGMESVPEPPEDEGDDPTPVPSTILARGSRGSAVRNWQKKLKRWNPNALPRYGADGDFGPETVEWSSRFMVATGLLSSMTENPRVGPRTQGKMKDVLKSRDGFTFDHVQIIGRGSTGAAVREWQKALKRWNRNALPRYGVDGDFGTETVEWTTRFMQATRLVAERPSNPRVGPRTRAKMVEVLGGSSAVDTTFSFQHTDVIRRGSRGAAVREWQQALQRWHQQALPSYGADGDFGDETARWTARFMETAGLVSERPSNPVVGSNTRAAMERALR